MTFVENIFQILNQKTQYAVARNHTGLPNQCNSRDIDIIIDKKEYKKVRPLMEQAAKEQGYLCLLVHQSDRFDTIIWEKENKLIQFDFFFGCSGKGVLLLTSEEITKKRLYDGNVYYLPEYMQFMDKFLFNQLVGQAYPEKYRDLRAMAESESAEEIEKILSTVFGASIKTAKQVEHMSVKERLYKARKQSRRRHFVLQVRQAACYWGGMLKYLFAPRGIFLSFTGPDGVGKTTVLEKTQQVYETIWKNAVHVHHFRPDVLPRLAELGKKTGAVKHVDEEYDKPHRGKNTNPFSSLIRLFYYMLDYQIGYCKKIFPIRFHREMTIYDRYYTDVIADSSRSNIALPFKFIYYMGKIVPQPQYKIFLLADPQVIVARKQELNINEITEITKKLEWMSKRDSRVICIHNDKTAEDAVLKVLKEIAVRQDRKYRGYFV